MITQKNGNKLKWSELFSYDPETGRLTWLDRPMVGKTGGLKTIGRLAGSRGSAGHCIVEVNGTNRYAHRIIWEMHNGPIRDGYVIDHIDGDGWNNRLENMRMVTQLQNGWNRKIGKNNTSGHVGVRYNKKTRKWMAVISADKKVINLGSFNTISEAICARKQGKEIHHKIPTTP